MIKKLVFLGLVMMIAFPLFAITKPEMKMEKGKPMPFMMDENSSAKTPYSAFTDAHIDKSANG